MNHRTLKSFLEEVSAISDFQKESGVMRDVGGKVVGAIKAGWKYGEHLPGKGWLGTGAMIGPETGRIGRAVEHVTSLGGATRYLPVGPKSLTLGFGAASLASSVKKEDPLGQGRSRAERLGQAVVGTAAGMAATPYGFAAIPAGMAGDRLGSYAGKAVNKATNKVKQLIKRPASKVPTHFEEPTVTPHHSSPYEGAVVKS